MNLAFIVVGVLLVVRSCSITTPPPACTTMPLLKAEAVLTKSMRVELDCVAT